MLCRQRTTRFSAAAWPWHEIIHRFSTAHVEVYHSLLHTFLRGCSGALVLLLCPVLLGMTQLREMNADREDAGMYHGVSCSSKVTRVYSLRSPSLLPTLSLSLPPSIPPSKGLTRLDRSIGHLFRSNVATGDIHGAPCVLEAGPPSRRIEALCSD